MLEFRFKLKTNLLKNTRHLNSNRSSHFSFHIFTKRNFIFPLFIPSIMSTNKRGTRSMATRGQVPVHPPASGTPGPRNVAVLASRWNVALLLALILATVALLAYGMVHLTLNRELEQLDNVIKDQAYFRNLTTHLSQLFSQMRLGLKPSMAAATGIRPPRIDHAQFNQGAKIIRFSGEEVVDLQLYSDRLRQFLGMSVPKGACHLLGWRLNKNKFLTFRGDRAQLLIELNQAVFLDTFKIEHFIANTNDTESIGNMPKNLIVSGIRKSSNSAIILGQLTLPLNTESNMQSAVLQFSDPRESFDWFQVEVLNNHGSKDLTRMYKIRMYGEVDDSK